MMEIVEPPDHARLIAELPQIERMSPQQRIQLARQRRKIQLSANHERERQYQQSRRRYPRLRFSSDIELLDATSRGDAEEVERLLQEGANPDSHNEDGLTPLHQCAIDNNEEIVQLLLRYGANVNATDTELWTPLHAAACCGYTMIVELLIEAHADLLALNAEGNMPYDICDDEATLDVIETHMANKGITQEFINARRSAPETDMLNEMKSLHFRTERLDARMPDGSTYLHVAAANGYNTVAAFLLRCGVEASLRDNDLWQPIHAAAHWNQPELIELLCEYGADINATTNQNETPLDLVTDEHTRQIITGLQQTEARKKRLAFGVRDSRRQSRKRKKFESPGQVPPGAVPADNPFSARGAIRRQSLRDRTGMTMARLEAQQEQSNLMRSWSKEDVSQSKLDDGSSGPKRAASLSDTRRDSPNKRVLNKSAASKVSNPHDQCEWGRKLDATFEDDDDLHITSSPAAGLAKATRGRSSTKKKKKKPSELNNGAVGSPVPPTPLNGGYTSRIAEKKPCCCIIL